MALNDELQPSASGSPGALAMRSALSGVPSLELLGAVWDSVTEAIAVSDPEGCVLLANPAYYALYGRTPEEVLGHSFALIFPPEQRDWAEEVYCSTFHSSTPSGQVEQTVRRADGTDLMVEARYDFLTENDERTAMISLVRDITERKRLEQTQRDILAMVIHDLRTPLTAIRGYAQMLQRRGSPNESMVTNIVEKTRLMERLISDLADVSRPDSQLMRLERSDVDLGALVEHAARQAQGSTSRHTIRIDVPSPSPRGWCDRIRLEQVMENLLSNAVKYSPDGGDIVVRVEAHDSEAQISVRDHGLGIPEELLGLIFDQFYRVERNAAAIDGWGLGLFITRRLIEAHGGRIWAESEGRGRGSMIVFTLPIIPFTSAMAERAESDR